MPVLPHAEELEPEQCLPVLPEQEMRDEKDFYPEGGRQAWLTVLGGFCALFYTFGKYSRYSR